MTIPGSRCGSAERVVSRYVSCAGGPVVVGSQVHGVEGEILTGNKVFLASAGREGTDGFPHGQPRAYVEVGDVAALPWWVDVYVDPGAWVGGMFSRGVDI